MVSGVYKGTLREESDEEDSGSESGSTYKRQHKDNYSSSEEPETSS